ncbi:MAG: DNA-binding protein [Pseudonocardiaceae bacterium]
MSMPPPDTPVPTRVSRSRTWSSGEIRALGATTDLLTAASVLRIGRTKAYHLARAGEFPVPVLRTGRRYLVAVAHLLRVLGMDTTAGA